MLDKLEKWKEKLNDLDKAEDHLEQLKEDYEKATEEAEDLIKILEEKYGKYLSEES